MKFWDASAVIPLCVDELHSKAMQEIALADDSLAAWWGTIVECLSAIARLRREEVLSTDEEDDLRSMLEMLSSGWTEIEPSDEIRAIAGRLLLSHSLRAADSLQLAAAIIWSGKSPTGHRFVCLDQRLREAARKEGFKVLPETM